MAQKISETINIPLFDINSSDPSLIKDYDMLILGTPVEAFRPAKETMAFIKKIPQTREKKVILFCTYALWKGATFGSLSRQLKDKGYECILKVSKKKVIPGKTDFSDVVDQIKRTLENLSKYHKLISAQSTIVPYFLILISKPMIILENQF